MSSLSTSASDAVASVADQRRERNRLKKRTRDEQIRLASSPEELAAKRRKNADQKLYTKIWRSAETGNLDELVWLLESKGLDPNYKSKSRDPLFVAACACGHAHIVQYLAIETKVNVLAVKTANSGQCWDRNQSGCGPRYHHMATGWRAAIVSGMVAVHDVLVAAAKHSDTFDNQPDLQTELARYGDMRAEVVRHEDSCRTAEAAIATKLNGTTCSADEILRFYGGMMGDVEVMATHECYQQHKGQIIYAYIKKRDPVKIVAITLPQLRKIHENTRRKVAGEVIDAGAMQLSSCRGRIKNSNKT